MQRNPCCSLEEGATVEEGSSGGKLFWPVLLHLLCLSEVPDNWAHVEKQLGLVACLLGTFQKVKVVNDNGYYHLVKTSCQTM